MTQLDSVTQTSKTEINQLAATASSLACQSETLMGLVARFRIATTDAPRRGSSWNKPLTRTAS